MTLGLLISHAIGIVLAMKETSREHMTRYRNDTFYQFFLKIKQNSWYDYDQRNNIIIKSSSSTLCNSIEYRQVL